MSGHVGSDRFDVVVVGAGMVGGSLATALARAGLSVAVVDRESPATLTDAAFDGRTSAIAHGSMRILDGGGIWPSLAPAAEPILDIRVSDGASPLFLHYDHTEVGEAPLGYIVENRLLRRAIFDHLARADGVTLAAPAAVAGVTRGAGGARVALADGRVLSAPLVVAADGRNSRLRRDAGIVVAEWTYRQTAIVCVAQHARIAASHTSVSCRRVRSPFSRCAMLAPVTPVPNMECTAPPSSGANARISHHASWHWIRRHSMPSFGDASATSMALSGRWDRAGPTRSPC